MMFVIKHLPALQILIPFLSALIIAAGLNIRFAWILASISSCLLLAVSIYGLEPAMVGISYAYGDWQAPIGIEYRLDYLNQPIIIFINFVLMFFVVLGKDLINQTVLKYIKENQQHLFLAMLLFAHAGYLGILSTNDIFNLYVFIEISSLATYVLISKGRNPLALIGSFDYLILGTIGATLILIAIFFLLGITGSLNATDISEILKTSFDIRLASAAIGFFLTGAILKMAFFPMHFWMIRAYSNTASIILTYLGAISSVIGIYMITRFIFFTVDALHIQETIASIFRPLAMSTIIICTILALRSNHFKEVIIYSTASQIGYIFMLMTIWADRNFLFVFILLDSLNKVALFTAVAHLESRNLDLRFAHFKHLESAKLFKILTALCLIFSASLPFTSMFLIKLKLFELLVAKSLWLEFSVVIIGSALALLYHFKLGAVLFFSPIERGTAILNSKCYGLIIIFIIQTITIFYVNDML